jgi:hypothetical protein
MKQQRTSDILFSDYLDGKICCCSCFILFLFVLSVLGKLYPLVHIASRMLKNTFMVRTNTFMVPTNTKLVPTNTFMVHKNTYLVRLLHVKRLKNTFMVRMSLLNCFNNTTFKRVSYKPILRITSNE